MKMLALALVQLVLHPKWTCHKGMVILGKKALLSGPVIREWSFWSKNPPPQDLLVEFSQSLLRGLPWYQDHLLGGGPIYIESLFIMSQRDYME